MAVRRNTLSARGVAGPATAPCVAKGPACPACGALECLCRPRFFAGQLLTEDDLRRLDRYIVTKNQLHLRHLHDWGTVCGLEVELRPLRATGEGEPRLCDRSLRQRHRGVRRGHGRRPASSSNAAASPTSSIAVPSPARPTAARISKRSGFLAIRYCERPSRGVAALRDGGASCGCGATSTCGTCGGCGSAGSCDGGCTCGEMPKATCGADGTWTPSRRLPKRASPPECEPTVTCESYVYEVFRKPEDGCDFGDASRSASPVA